MIYRFRSPATGDVVMLGESGDELLRLLGREPARQGIFEPVAMPAAIEALQRAVAAAERPSERPAEGDEDSDRPRRAVSLRQRVWPMLQMLQRALAAEQPITWGV